MAITDFDDDPRKWNIDNIPNTGTATFEQTLAVAKDILAETVIEVEESTAC